MPAQGNALGGAEKMPPALKGRHKSAALSGLDFLLLATQGVALGWHVCAPLVLPSRAGIKCMTSSNPP